MDNVPLNGSIPILNLDPDDSSDIAVNIYPLWCKNMEMDQNETKLLRMVAHFRLIATCENRVNKGDLQNIDALLSCPILLPSNLDSVHPEVLIITINWFIEVINGFVQDSSYETRGKIFSHIRHIVTLCSHLKQSLSKHLEIFLPVAKFNQCGSNKISSRNSLKSSSGTVKQKKAKAIK